MRVPSESPEKRTNFARKKNIEGDKTCSLVTVTWKHLQFKINEGVSKIFSQCQLMLVGLQQFVSFENDLAQGRYHLLAILTEKNLVVKYSSNWSQYSPRTSWSGTAVSRHKNDLLPSVYVPSYLSTLPRQVTNCLVKYAAPQLWKRKIRG